MKNLVIVESPAKARTLEKFLGKDFSVTACGGHIRDLPRNKLGVDVEHDFAPTYVTIKGKTKIIKALAKEANSAAKIYLAPDPDREGEAIAWHLQAILGNATKIKRIEFHEITKNAVQEAIKHPREIDLNRVNAQQVRRILDRLVGYKISPLLWKKVRKGLSAGRVQSVVVRLICEREKEIEEFKPQEYWSISALLSKLSAAFTAKYQSKDIIPNQAEAQKIKDACQNADFIVKKITHKEQKRNPSAPFITATLQQDASRKLGYSAKKTMAIAQQLYEGIDIKGEGHVGLITYMRTDSVRIANEALAEARKYIEQIFGAEYLPESARHYKAKKSAQDAHEAIRPTSAFREPQKLKDSLTPDQLKLYALIWSRFTACQMSHAVMSLVAADILANQYNFRANGQNIKFDGFLKLYSESHDKKDEDSGMLPELTEGEKLKLESLEPKQHFTEPPPRYNEASLIKELEERGIGRPSTYAPTISTIEDRGYVLRENRVFTPTELGKNTNMLLVKHFPSILNYEFTAHMEDSLDDIVAGKLEYLDVLKEFYPPFEASLKEASEKMENIKVEIKTDEKCPNCGKFLVIRAGRFGEFMACSGFPDCKFTKPIIKSLNIKCPREGCDGEILVRRTRKGKIFYSCSGWPKCTVAYWDKPTGEACPKCHALLVEKKAKGDLVVKCSNKACDYKKE
ncbi:MAG: DNA topoisomerase I [Candidatus Saganbacteria bacterium]|uniref:DNA topoisomerase 1 n=1 Tax=Candidatus Saganbacteria bacterium TaxID=2575572 RepID=A0A833L4V7_UNCSA|nr:MAG: DNA topoisomerase I [Candidatus Saganbacteria bacterium]